MTDVTANPDRRSLRRYASTDSDRERGETTPARSRTLVDMEGAAERLTVTVRFMRSLVAERRIRYLKVGKYVRFDVRDLDDWLDRCRVEATAE
jgi:excisionase family DNA binding protein